MQDKFSPDFNTVKSPWRSVLMEEVKKVRNKIFCISPFFTEDVISNLEDVLISKGYEANSLTIHVLTRLRLDDLSSGASELEAFKHILSWPNRFSNWQVELRAEDRIHAKVWIIDSNTAFVGSGNMTHSGLDRNIEYGVAITNSDFIQLIQRDWSLIWDRSQAVTLSDLQNMQDILEDERTDPEIMKLKKSLARLREEMAQRRNFPLRLGTHNSSASIAYQDQPTTSQKKLSDIPNKYSEAMLARLTLESVLENDSQQKLIQNNTLKDIKSTLPNNTIRIKTYDLFQALNWISPAIENLELLNIPPIGFNYNEFIWRADQFLLYCYAGRQFRRSQAIIKTLESSGETNWHISLTSGVLKDLQNRLQAILFQDKVSFHSSVLLHFDSNNQKLVLAQSEGIEKILSNYDTQYTRDDSKWKHWQLHSQYRITTKHINLINALIALKNMWIGEAPDGNSMLNLSEINYRLRLTLYPGQRQLTLQEPILKIRMEEADLEKAVETTIDGNGKKYFDPLKSKVRLISFNDLVLALQGAPELIRHWRIHLDTDNLTNFDGITNRKIVGLRPEKPPQDIENIPELLEEWWHMLYSFRD